jgi:hypothetical protein
MVAVLGIAFLWKLRRIVGHLKMEPLSLTVGIISAIAGLSGVASALTALFHRRQQKSVSIKLSDGKIISLDNTVTDEELQKILARVAGEVRSDAGR